MTQARRWRNRGFALAMAMITAFAISRSHATEPQNPLGIRLTAVIRDRSVGEAVELVAALAGQRLELSGFAGDRRVSLTLYNVTLGESLERILHPLNYVVHWSARRPLSVHVLTPAGTGAAGANQDEEIAARSKLPPSFFPGEVEVLPPDELGGRGITARDVAYYHSLSLPAEPSEIEVLPANELGEPGVTQAEVEFYDAVALVPSPFEIEVVPGGPGVTVQDLRSVLQPERPARILADEVPPEYLFLD